MASPAKKLKLESSCLGGDSITNVFIIPKGIQKRRLTILEQSSKKFKIPLVKELSPVVTHIVTAKENFDETLDFLKSVHFDLKYLDDNSIEVVKDTWLSKCIEMKKLVPVQEEWRLYPSKAYEAALLSEKVNEGEEKFKAGWVLFKKMPLKHFNSGLTDALEVLQMDAEFRHDNSDPHSQNHYSRALAFRRASSVLKTLPYRITSSNVKTIKGMPHIGDKHAFRVIQEMIEEGFSAEVETIENDEWFQKMKVFTKTFGVGPSTSKRLIKMGLSSIEEARAHPDITSTSTQVDRLSVGLAYYEDLTYLVNRNEAEALASYIRGEAERILPGTRVDLTGGFRRGKESGHDIDLLISHPEEGREVGLLPKLINRLKKFNIILFDNYERGSFDQKVLSDVRQKGEYLKSTLDYFEKWIGVLKIDKTLRDRDEEGRTKVYDPTVYSPDPVLCKRATPSMDSIEASTYKPPLLRKQSSLDTAMGTARGERTWLARRVDLIVTPASQYPWALVGWTGSRHFNRELRRYTEKRLDGKLTSHGMFHYPTSSAVEAKTEEEVFEKLKIPYLEPEDRNA